MSSHLFFWGNSFLKTSSCAVQNEDTVGRRSRSDARRQCAKLLLADGGEGQVTVTALLKMQRRLLGAWARSPGNGGTLVTELDAF